MNPGNTENTFERSDDVLKEPTAEELSVEHIHFAECVLGRKHEEECHEGQEVKFKATVTHSNRDCLSRQIREGVQIRRSSKPILNSRTEWFQPPLFRVLNNVVRE